MQCTSFPERIRRILYLLVALPSMTALGQFYQQDQSAILYSYTADQRYQRGVNYSSFRGVPGKTGAFVGADGRISPQGSPNQYRGVVTYGMVVRSVVVNSSAYRTNWNFEQNAVALSLPRGSANGAPVLRACQAGAPYYSRLVSYSFGSVIPPPSKNATGNVLISPTTFWDAEPYTATTHDGKPYYWSPHARAVFATQPGQINITWRKIDPDTNLGGVEGVNKATIGGLTYYLTNLTYVVSGAAVKKPRQMYWTEKTFRGTGKPVVVPTARIGAVYFHYNSQFPRTNNTEFSEIGESSITDAATNSTLQELRTLWYDDVQGLILAYNREGRAFMELLGDPTSPGIRKHLGFEIVDVMRQPQAVDLTVDLGEKISPRTDNLPDDSLIASPIHRVIADQFLYQHGSVVEQVDYYAVKETTNPNDVLVHWLEAGVEGLRWPALFARYQQIWPDDPRRYSHYVRPPVANESEAALTPIVLPTDNAPAIQYQDPMDQPRAKLTAKFELYTFLDEVHPVHRTLLRFNSGDNVAFERVLSTLSTPMIGAGQMRASAGSATVDAGVPVLPTRVGRGAFLNLDGATGYGRLPSGVYFGNTGFTIESWVFVRSHKNWQRLLDFGNGTPSDNVILALSQGVNGIPLGVVNRGAAGGSTVAVASALPLNQWVHVAMVQDAPVSGAMSAPARLYVGGVLKASGTNSVPNAVTRNRVFVGKSNWAGDALADVAMDDLRLWSVSRTAAQIVSDMDNTGFAAGTTGLVAQFGFAEGGPVAYDSSGNGNHMTLYGAAVMDTDTSRPSSTSDGLADLGRSAVPRYVQAVARVGDRIQAPTDEVGADGAEYLAGYIYEPVGNSYDVQAYQNPFTNGFGNANLGAIIPVNAIPGRDVMEVWWFRRNATNGVRNTSNGFKTVYWPSVIARYQLVWPTDSSEIVMADNRGSGALESLQAKGSVYVQNDSTLAGYNPNEEHALMIGGQAYALRDDLNVLSGADYSSHPYVLLKYVAEDGRPAMRVFKVLREKPEVGSVFDYIVEAGSRLQAPMPLPLLPSPVEIIQYTTSGVTMAYSTNYNAEPPAVGGDLPRNWSASVHGRGPYGHYTSFTYKDRKENFWVLRGLHEGLPPLRAGRFTPRQGATPEQWETNLVVGIQRGTMFTNYIHTSRMIGSLVTSVIGTPLPDGVQFGALPMGLAVYGSGPSVTETYTLAITDGDDATAVVTFRLEVGGTAKPMGPILIPSTNVAGNYAVTFVGRPPRLADPAGPTNSFAMRFYYKTQAGFAWPGLDNPPAIGSVVPYLRPRGSNVNPATNSTPALDIVYRPTWPGAVPEVAFGETLTVASKGRPAMRGQTSLKILYQQSIAANITSAPPAAVLLDPTREKMFDLVAGETALAKIPDGVNRELYQGKTYFPNLPPHLSERFFYDPNRGVAGSLVLRGEFKDELFGEKYLLLNVLTGSDLATIKGLCPSADPNKAKWDAAIDGLATTVETFYENPSVPGQFIVNPALTGRTAIDAIAVVTNDNTAVDSYALSAVGPGQGYVTLIAGNGAAFTPPAEPVSMYVLRVTGKLYRGEIKVMPASNPLNELVTFQHTADLAGRFGEYEYQWKMAPPVDGYPPVSDSLMSRYQDLVEGLDNPRYTLGGSGIKVLVDNYVVMRYRPKNPLHPLYSAAPTATATNWSEWTEPALAEGWIKRVLAGINPFGQRVTDLYNNSVNTDASMLMQAGKRYEGDIALNLESMNNYGLIEIYETVLKRGRGLSIDAGINFGPANDALLLAAGYLNDLYMFLGNDAYADASNPTIGIGTKGGTYGSIATALFAFRGQMPTLLDEELGLLRGRDDVALPGVETAPVYNRLVWNYTRGIDAGEVIYALNYNILDQDADGRVNASDAAKLYPQGHGDAYGHYMTAVKGYYSLLMNPNFDWVPRIEAVNVLGKPVTVDYLDERKLAAAAGAVARTGRQILELEWRKGYQPGATLGWDRFGATRVSARQVENGVNNESIVRKWGVDHWASRTLQGAFVNWVVGNSILPAVDPDPSHEGIQKVDRTTVPELSELAATAGDVQSTLDNAEARMTPLGLPEGAVAFDVDPTRIVGSEPKTHFEQVYERAVSSLNNAVVAFDDSKDVTGLMRSESDTLYDLQTQVSQQEMAYTNALIEIYGTPYPDDVGPGKTFKQGYEGPDLIHYVYVENPELTFGSTLDPRGTDVFKLDIHAFPSSWISGNMSGAGDMGFVQLSTDPAYSNYITYTLSPHGYFQKPTSWTGKRTSPGQIQQAISDVIKARNSLQSALGNSQSLKAKLDAKIRVFKAGETKWSTKYGLDLSVAISEQVTKNVERANDLWDKIEGAIKEDIEESSNMTLEAFPKSIIAGLAAGGDLTSAGRAAVEGAGLVITKVVDGVTIARNAVVIALRAATDAYATSINSGVIPPLERTEERRKELMELDDALQSVQGCPNSINAALQAYDDAQRALRALVAKGDRLQKERQVFRQRTAAVVQGYRTRDAAYRIFRNEKLERYQSLFELASRYAYLAAMAYDYETGLLGTDAGRGFVNRIVSSRALGIVRDGQPQFAGSDLGDPGVSSALAEMKADWDVLRGRLGFNAPNVDATLVSLRGENQRILPGAAGAGAWQDYLQQCRVENIVDDPDVRRYCLQAGMPDGRPVPGLILTFSSTITPGNNFFGHSLAAGDSSFHRSSFATKIYGVGVVLDGYRGMNVPGYNSSATYYASGSTGAGDPSLAYLDPDALAATPYVYLIPVGLDTMRVPPLGDMPELRSWQVNDVAIPLPFNVGASDFARHNFYYSSSSLTEPLFDIRKHPAFRPVDSTAPFADSSIWGSQWAFLTNRRLAGRSVWNSQWKLVIPGDALLNDPKEGLNRFVRTVSDVKLYLSTYSYAGN